MMRHFVEQIVVMLALVAFASTAWAADGDAERNSEESAPSGEVVEQRDGAVIVDLGRDDGIERGQHIELYEERETDLGGDETSTREERVAVGRVVSVGETRAEVDLGINERVDGGTLARPTDEDLSQNRTTPPRMGGIWELEFMARPFLALGTLGAGSVGHLRATHRFKKDIALEAQLNPFSFALAEEGHALTLGGDVGLAYDTRVFSVGLGAGAFELDQYYVSERDDIQEVGFGLTQKARLGAQDGLNVTARNAFVLENNEFIYGGTEGAVQVPLSMLDFLGGAWGIARGGGYVSGSYYGEIGLRVLLKGNGDSGSLFVTPTIGAAGVDDVEYDCSPEQQEANSDGGVCDDVRSYGGPMVGFGMEWRY